MNATAKFYTGLAIVLAIIVSASFAIGYRTGYAHAEGTQAMHRAVHHRMPAPTLAP